MNDKKISIARDFSRTPGPRYIRQGNWSGEKFRRSILEPALKDGGKLIVDLDKTRGYGSSFLEEAFGGLIREGVLSYDEALERIQILSADDPSYKIEAEQAMRRARAKQAA